MTATVEQLLALALTKVGYRYATGPTRTTGAGGYFDCSGFTEFLNNHVGGPTPGWEPQSHLQALYCRDHGLLAPGALGSQAQINAVPIGGLLFEGPQHAYVGGAGIPGHAAVKLSATNTVEAMGHAWGVCVGRIAGRNWSNGGRFPGIDYAGAVPSMNHPPDTPGPQLQGDQMAIVIPARAHVVGGRVPNFMLDVQSDHIFAYNGAKLKWHMPSSAPEQTPTKLGNFLVYDIPTNGPHFGLVETDDPHTLLPNNILCVTAADGGCAFADMVLP